MNRQNLFFSLRQSLDDELAKIIEGGDPGRLEQLRSDVRTQPGHADRRFRLATLYQVLGNHSEALNELDAATEINPRFIDALRLKASIYCDHGKLDSALQVYQEILKHRPNDSDGLYNAAAVLARLGDSTLAIEYAQKVLGSPDNHAKAHLLLAQQYLHAGEWEKAVDHYAAANRLRPNEETCYIAAVLNLKLARKQPAEELLEQALHLKPNHLNALVRLALIKVADGDYERAHHLLRLAREFYPKYPDLAYSLAKVCLLMGRRNEAHDLMRTALTLNPNYAEVRREMGYLYSVLQKNDDAIDELQQSLEIDPKDEQAYINLGFVYSNEGQHEKAIGVLEQALSRFPESWRLQHSLGVVHLQHRSFVKARFAFSEAVSINPDLELAQRSLRIAFQDESLLEEERDRLTDRFSRDDQRAELDHHLGLLHLDFGREKICVTFLQRSLDAGFRPTINSLLLATVYANMQNFELAAQTLEKFTEDGHRETIRGFLLGLFHANANNHLDSLRYYQQVMTRDQLFFHALGGVGVCFREPEELDDMLSDYTDYERFYDRNARLFCRLGEIRSQKGTLVEANRCFLQATLLDKDEARAYHGVGVVLLLRLDLTGAVANFTKAIDKAPDWALPHLALAVTERWHGRTRAVMNSLRRYIRLETIVSYRDQAVALLSTLEETTPVELASA